MSESETCSYTLPSFPAFDWCDEIPPIDKIHSIGFKNGSYYENGWIVGEIIRVRGNTIVVKSGNLERVIKIHTRNSKAQSEWRKARKRLNRCKLK